MTSIEMSDPFPAENALEAEILSRLKHQTYAQIETVMGISRGKIYKVALKYGARKNERRIRQRESEAAADRRRRRQAFLQEALDASHTADVLDFCHGLPDECIDLHCTSLPYNVGKPYGGDRQSDAHRYHYYLGWVLQCLSEMNRTLAPGGVLFLQLGATHDDDGGLLPLDCVLLEYLRHMGLRYQNRVVWPVPHGLTPKRRLAGRHETALVFSKGELKHFNAASARVPQKQPGKRAYKGPNKGQISSHPLGAHPTDVWSGIGNLGHNHPERKAGGGHPAQFPQALAERAIRLYTRPGELVCDLFDGSGTTTSVAKAEGRSFIGCDLFYEDVRRQRLAAIEPSLYSALPGVTEESIAVWQAEAVPRRHTAPAAPAAVQQTLLDLV